MTSARILLEGFTNVDCREKGEPEETRATSALVVDDGFVVVTDPGVLKNTDDMAKALRDEGLKYDDVTHVFLTHSHIDHYRNLGLFPKAKTVEYYGVWHDATCEDRQEFLTPNIQIFETPGHDRTSLSMIVTTEQGKIAIVGDVWWKECIPKHDKFADDPEALESSRKMIAELADYIIPGHGGMYKVTNF